MKKIIISFFLLSISSCDMKYIEFKPVILREDKLIIEDSIGTTESFQKNIILVLDYYKVSYKIDSNTKKILIPDNINDELIWNYTTKACDSIWLSSHKIQ